ncbi:MAG: AraC family transcriptional regulator ligand-binding domain-containing protein [Myxococcota bacterium]
MGRQGGVSSRTAGKTIRFSAVDMVGPRYKHRGSQQEKGPGSGRLRPTVHPAYARLLVVELRKRGLGDQDIFVGTRLGWEQLLEDDRFISFEQFARLARRGRELTGEGWLGLDVGRSMQVSSHGPVAYAMIASRDVGQALDLAARYASLRMEVAELRIERKAERVELHLEDRVGWGDLAEYVSSTILGSVTLLLETVSGGNLPDARMFLAHTRPAWENEYASRLRGISLTFDAGRYVLDLPASFLATPCITADPAAYEQALRLCERAAAQRSAGDDFVQRVLDSLLECEGEYPSLSETASALHVSDRTLIRKLKAQGTSYQNLLDDVRQELTVWYLKHTDLSIESIAVRVGYRDPSNFSRTCKRWFGTTPSAIRDGAL